MENRATNPSTPLTLVIFGATGDLYKTKLAPALFDLHAKGMMPGSWQVVGFGRRGWDDGAFKTFTEEAIWHAKKKVAQKTNPVTDMPNVEVTEDAMQEFLTHLAYAEGDLENAEDFKKLAARLGAGERLLYFAIQPMLYGHVIQNVKEASLATPQTKVLFEKPFGASLAQAEELNSALHEIFTEPQIFRVDHYLAKATVQAIADFRFEDDNAEKMWNKDYIDRVHILFRESNDVSARGAFYDSIGALRDVGQNHMLAMLAVTAMENPNGAGGIKHAREAILGKTFLRDNPIARGQYAGYLDTPNVMPGSQTETFFRVTLGVDTDRWRGVPFVFEGGKALAAGEVLVEVCFKDQNKECKRFFINSDKPAYLDAYEKVFHDAIAGDQTFFVSATEVMAEWKLVGEIINAWQNVPLVIYEKGSDAKDIN